MMLDRIIDESVAPPTRRDASKPRWGLFVRQFDLVRTSDGTTYLTRWWIIATPMGGLVLHRMQAPDARITIHDHPFSFASFVLRGGYIERRLRPREMVIDDRRVVRRVNVMRKHDAHSIIRLLRVPTWTLLFVGPQRRTWGFWHEIGGGEWRWIRHDRFDSGHYVP